MKNKKAINRGYIPYGRQLISPDDIQAVVDVLLSDWLTTGPQVDEFEVAMSLYTGSQNAVAVSSGTAALHAAIDALGIGSGDEVIVPAMTFAATANCVVYNGGTPVFADVDPASLLIDLQSVESLISERTKAIIAVDYAGQPCDYDSLRAISEQKGLALIADACHSLGAENNNRKVGTLADLTVFSFHPVKHITTGEGGMVVTDNELLAKKIQRFRNHGINSDHRQRQTLGTWFYDMETLGFNYRLTDFQAALGKSQLKKNPEWLHRRRQIADQYTTKLKELTSVHALKQRVGANNAYHLYVVVFEKAQLRDQVYENMRANGVGVNVHYIPVHLHSFYKSKFGYGLGTCPIAEKYYQHILSLPIHPGMKDEDVDYIFNILAESVSR